MVDSAFNLSVKRENNPDIGVIQDAVFNGESFAFNPRYSYTTMSSVLKFAAIEREVNRGIEVFIKPQGYEVAYVADKNVLSSATGTHKHLINLLTATPWKTLHDNGTCRVRYCLRGGFMYLDCYLAAGASTYTTPEELPKDLLPAIEGYYSMGTQSGNDTAKIWIGSADGGDGHIYLYNWSSGYATGLFTFIPKSFE